MTGKLMPDDLILLVEDDRDIRESMALLLEDEGYSVAQAENGREALRILEGASSPPCVIALDLFMPVMDGRAFLRALLADSRFASIAVILTTAAAPAARKDLEGQTAAILPKPIDVEEFLRLVAKHCRCKLRL